MVISTPDQRETLKSYGQEIIFLDATGRPKETLKIRDQMNATVVIVSL